MDDHESYQFESLFAIKNNLEEIFVKQACTDELSTIIADLSALKIKSIQSRHFFEELDTLNKLPAKRVYRYSP